jgi:tetratricopeptide (TPR) repeat protein
VRQAKRTTLLALGTAALAGWPGAAAVSAPARAQGPATPHAVASPPVDDEVLQHLARGEALHRAFSYPESAREFEAAHRLNPERFVPLERLCHVYNDLGHGASGRAAESFYERAAAHAEALRQRFPDRAEGHFWVAAGYGNLALFKGGRDKVRLARGVEASARQAIALDPGYAPAYVALGIYYRELAELSWVLRAFAKLLVGGLPKATREDSEAVLRKAVELDPGSVLARYQFGLTLRSLDRDAEAADQFRVLVALPPAEAQDRRNQADAEALLKRMKRK